MFATLCFHWVPNDLTKLVIYIGSDKEKVGIACTEHSTLCIAVHTVRCSVTNHHQQITNISSESKLVLSKAHWEIFTVELFSDLASFIRS